MTRTRLAINIRNKLKEEGIDVSKDTIEKIIEIEEDEIYMLIATNDFMQYSWGKIGGTSKAPVKISGNFTKNSVVRANHGWSSWRVAGVPYIEWSKAAKVPEKDTAEHYFELEPQRYSTPARQFRKDAGLPEIPEFQGLDEEKILEICKKTDDLIFSQLPKKKQRNKLKDDRNNAKKKKGLLLYWKENPDDIPMYPTNPEYTGPTRDEIDSYIKKHIDIDNIGLQEKLDEVRNAIDFAIEIEAINKHMDLYELEKELQNEIIKNGLTEIPHVKKEFQGIATSKYKGVDFVESRVALEKSKADAEKARKDMQKLHRKIKKGQIKND